MSYTIQISIYNWFEKNEEIYEAKVNSFGEYYELTKDFYKSVKVKKSTDKNWYYIRTLGKRLFKEELSTKPSMELIKINNLDHALELRRVEKERKEQIDEVRRKKSALKYSMDRMEESYGYTLIEAREYLLNNIPVLEY